MKQTPLEEKLTALFAPAIEDRGLRLVCVRMFGDGGLKTIQVMAENPATRKLGVDDCAKISREIAALLDVEDIMKDAYRLEVSSPGIDRPLVNLQDFADFSGFEAKVEIDPPLEGRKRFKGRLKGTDNGLIKMETENGAVALPFAAINKAKLILTDELLKSTK
jgi:ribosome maturation factor RimP